MCGWNDFLTTDAAVFNNDKVKTKINVKGLGKSGVYC